MFQNRLFHHAKVPVSSRETGTFTNQSFKLHKTWIINPCGIPPAMGWLQENCLDSRP